MATKKAATRIASSMGAHRGLSATATGRIRAKPTALPSRVRTRFDQPPQLLFPNGTNIMWHHHHQPRIYQQQRSIHFLPLLGLWGAKKLAAYTVYNACREYGWSRVYRRLLEHNRRIHPAMRAQTQSFIRMGIEEPPKFAAQISKRTDVIMPFLEGLAMRAAPSVPPFLVTLAKYIMKSRKPVKLIQDLASMVAGRAPKK